MEIMEVLQSILIMAIVAGVCTGIKVSLQYINLKINNNLLDGATFIVQDAVDEVSQTYVESLKNKNKFDKDAQKEALQKAVDIATNNMSYKMKNYIIKNSDNLTDWIISQIESYIWKSKSSGSIATPIKLNG